MSRVDQDAPAIAGASDGVVRLHAIRVASASLHIAVQKMAVDRVEDDLRNLRAGGVIEEDEGGLLIERGKQRPDAIGRKGDGSGCAQLLIDHLAHGDS